MQKMFFGDRHLAAVLFLIFSFYIVGSSYVGINGEHGWRQADSYSQILGFSGYKDFKPFEDFQGKAAIYDIPIYQFIVSKVSIFVLADPLVVTKYVNVLLLLLLAVSGFLTSEKFWRGSGIYFLFLISTSRVFLHFYSAPMPDNMALALSAAAVAILIADHRPGPVLLSSLMLATAALIKSPIPFVFIVFLAMYFLLQRERGRRLSNYAWLALPVMMALVAALAAEKTRMHLLRTNVEGFAQDPRWYFGTINQRLSSSFWIKIFERAFKANPLAALFVGFVVYLPIRAPDRKFLAFPIAIFSGWLVFSNVYYIHDYYEMPVDVMFYMLLAIAAQVSYESILESPFVSRFAADTVLSARNLLLACVALVFVVYMPKLSDFRATSVYKSINFALRDVDQFILVDDGGNRLAIGAMLDTKYKKFMPREFERNCATIIDANRAVLVFGHSDCLKSAMGSASTYIEDDGVQFYLRDKTISTQSTDLKRGALLQRK